MVIPPNVWLKNRLNHLKRLIICAHVRHKRTSASSGSSSSAAASSTSTLSTLLTDAKPEEFSVYKSSLIYFAFVNNLYIKMFKVFDFVCIQINSNYFFFSNLECRLFIR